MARLAQPRCVAGDGAEESLQQPRFDADGRLYCLTDRARLLAALGGIGRRPEPIAQRRRRPWPRALATGRLHLAATERRQLSGQLDRRRFWPTGAFAVIAT